MDTGCFHNLSVLDNKLLYFKQASPGNSDVQQSLRHIILTCKCSVRDLGMCVFRESYIILSKKLPEKLHAFICTIGLELPKTIYREKHTFLLLLVAIGLGSNSKIMSTEVLECKSFISIILSNILQSY